MNSKSKFEILKGIGGIAVAVNGTRVTENKVYGMLVTESSFNIDDDAVIKAITEKLTTKEKLQKIQQWLSSNAEIIKKEELIDDLEAIVKIINERT